MSNYKVITDADSAIGFRLAGVETLVAGDVGEAERILQENIATGAASLILLNQQFMDKFSDSFHRKLDKLSLPLIIPIPISSTWWKEEPSQDYVFNLIRRAIGYQMKIKRG
jgi:V/A-type H+-transporting ATPase subunit F